MCVEMMGGGCVGIVVCFFGLGFCGNLGWRIGGGGWGLRIQSLVKKKKR